MDGSIPLNKRSHHAASSLDTQGKRSNVKEQKVRDFLRGVTSQNCCLDSSTISYSLVGIDGLVQLLSVKEILEKLLNLRNPCRTSNQDNVIDAAFVHLGIPHCLFYRLEGSLEEVRAKFFKSCPCDRCVKVYPFKEGIYFNVGLSRGRESPLGPLAGSSQPPKSSLVTLQVLLMLPLELVDEVINHSVVKVFTSQVSVSSSGFHFENSLLDCQDGNIKGSTTKIED